MSRRLARRARAVCGVFVLTLVGLAGCVPGSPPPPDIPAPAAREQAVTRHVIIVSIDGLRPDAIEATNAPTLQRLVAEGAFSLHAETILPSSTLPSHTSMLTGLAVEAHGITWNTDRTRALGTVEVPTVFELTRAAGMTTAAFLGKRKLRHLLRPGSLDWPAYPRMDPVSLSDDIAQQVAEYLRFRQPNLLFAHIPDPDLAGHAFGWMSRPYRVAVRRADRAVRQIHAAATRAFGDDFVLIVTSDHGGEGRRHGRDTEADVRIPWIAWGRGVEPGEIDTRMRTYDTAATALWLLGLEAPRHWAGRPASAFIHLAD